MVIRGMSEYDLTPLEESVKDLIKHQIVKSTPDDLVDYLTAITGTSLALFIKSPHVEELTDSLVEAIGIISKIIKESKT